MGRRRSAGENLHKPSPLWEALVCNPLDNGQGISQSLSSRGHILKDGGNGAGSFLVQSSRGTPELDTSLNICTGVPIYLVPLDTTEGTMTEVDHQLSGGAGPERTDAVSLQHWFHRSWEVRAKLRHIFASVIKWLANLCLPWAAYCTLIAVCLIGMDKQPGVIPVGVGNTWRICFAKCVLAVAVPEAKDACGTEQLCRGMESRIEGRIHVIRMLWYHHLQEEYWGFLLIDVHNMFNEDNRSTMIWLVHQK